MTSSFNTTFYGTTFSLTEIDGLLLCRLITVSWDQTRHPLCGMAREWLSHFPVINHNFLPEISLLFSQEHNASRLQGHQRVRAVKFTTNPLKERKAQKGLFIQRKEYFSSIQHFCSPALGPSSLNSCNARAVIACPRDIPVPLPPRWMAVLVTHREQAGRERTLCFGL